MAGDYTTTKRFGKTIVDGELENENNPTNAYPVESIFTSGSLKRIEPIVTPELLKSRYLKGIDVSKYSDEEIKDHINLAINEVELMTGLNLDKIQFKERKPFDRDHYREFVYFKLNNGPILSLEHIAIESSNGENIYNLPADWIEMGFAHKRQINMIPILSVFGASGLQDGQASNAGLVFIQAINNFQWMPAFFSITYTTGVCHKEGSLPIVLNDILGMSAAIELLSAVQTNFKYNSTSISQDGISQASSGAAGQTYQPRIEMLEAKRAKQLAKIKAEFSVKYFLSNI